MSEHQSLTTSSVSASPASPSPASPSPASPSPASAVPGSGSPVPEPAQPLPQPGAPRQGQRRDGAGGRSPILLWTVAVLVILVDQATKAWALSRLGAGERISLPGDLIGLVLVRNPGAAFSLASGYTWVLALVALGVIGVVVRVSRRLASSWWAVVLGLVLGGAVGNLADRLVRPPGFLRGHVIDFISYNGYFVGNVADIAIVAAAAGIVVLSLAGHELDGTRRTDDADHGRADHGRDAASPAQTEGPEAGASARSGLDDLAGSGQGYDGIQGQGQS